MSGLEPWILTAAAFLTAGLSAVVGMAGGMTLLVVMLFFYEPLVAIPLHGVVQLVSNVTRAGIQREHIRWPIVGRFALLLLPSGLLGLHLARGLPREALRVLIGAFVLFATWAPGTRLWPRRDRSAGNGEESGAAAAGDRGGDSPTASAGPSGGVGDGGEQGGGEQGGAAQGGGEQGGGAQGGGCGPAPLPGRRFVILGGVSGAASVTIGATGPLLSPFFLDLGLTRHQVIGTKAACQSAQHLAKIAVFGLAGFAFGDHLAMLVLLSAAVVAGSWAGSWVLERVNEVWFVRLYKGILTALALRLLLVEGSRLLNDLMG